MKQAIKILQARIELLDRTWVEKDTKLDNCEMVSDIEFLRNDLTNIELEIIELQKAIKVINENIK